MPKDGGRAAGKVAPRPLHEYAGHSAGKDGSNIATTAGKTEMRSDRPEFSKAHGLGLGLSLLLATSVAVAQAPVEDIVNREQAIQRSQQATGAAYRDLQQAQFESKLAEQEFLNAQEADRLAQEHAQERRRQLESAKKALDAAKSNEAQARKRYDRALTSVDKAFQRPPDGKK
jgi:hypothetical protein